jgi:hypothetical protein
MKAEVNGYPVIARARWGLGVRIEGDEADVDVTGGHVRPLGGGMSVTRDWNLLPKSFIPRQLDEEGTAPKSYVMFSLEEELVPADLHPRLDEPPPGHYVLEPRSIMPIEAYEALLGGTQGLWEQVIA